MMNGIGTPKNNNKIERIVNLHVLQTALQHLSQKLNNRHTIAFPAANRRGEAGAKRTDQERDKQPIQHVGHGLPCSVSSLSGCGNSVSHPPFSLGLRETGSD